MRKRYHGVEKALSWLSHQPLVLRFFVSLAALAIVTFVDFITGQEISIAFLYMLPLLLATPTMGFLWGLFFATAAVACERFLLPVENFATSIQMWNTAVRLVNVVLVVWLLDALRHTLVAEREAARHDFLTGLLNRRAFEQAAEIELERCRRTGSPLSLLYVDCDEFKQVNDKFGHAHGDKVLQNIGQLMATHLRSTDAVARIGGDEFVALLPATGESQARAAAKKLHDELAKQLSNLNGGTTCSLGVAVFAAAPEGVDDLIRRADEVMYAVKADGKGAARVDVFFGH